MFTTKIDLFNFGLIVGFGHVSFLIQSYFGHRIEVNNLKVITDYVLD